MAGPEWNNGYSLRKLLVNTFAHAEVSNRFEYKERDVLKGIRIEKRDVRDQGSAARRWTVYRIRSFSYPQYPPYISKKKVEAGRRQRRYKHQYEVTISLPRLSIDAPVKLRTGADRKWDFSSAGKSRKLPNGYIKEGSNVINGVNGDFFFRLEYLYAKHNILFGHNWTNGPPNQVNPRGIVFLDKHMLRVVEQLMARGILGQG